MQSEKERKREKRKRGKWRGGTGSGERVSNSFIFRNTNRKQQLCLHLIGQNQVARMCVATREPDKYFHYNRRKQRCGSVWPRCC